MAAGAVAPLIALLASPAVGVQEGAAGALGNVSVYGAHARAQRLVMSYILYVYLYLYLYCRSWVMQPRTRSQSRPRAPCHRSSHCWHRGRLGCRSALRWHWRTSLKMVRVHAPSIT